MREQLVRYLLGELDGAEQSQLEEQLRESPELRRELAYLQSCFASGKESPCEPVEPPRGLAERTSERVASLAESDDGLAESAGLFEYASGRVAAFAGDPDPPAGPLGWNLADISVAAGVCLALSMLLAPALRNSQDASRRNACTNNMRETYLVIAPYAERNGGRVPAVNPHEYAGMFFVRLVADDYVSLEDARKWLACSGSPLGDLIRNGKAEVFIPSKVQIRNVRGESLAGLFRTSTGSYAVPLPSIRENGQYERPNLFDASPMPILADGPRYGADGIKNQNHFGGLNVLYFSGCVKFQAKPVVPPWNDQLFVNVLGQPAAGVGAHDSVLVTGDRTPGVDFIGENRRDR